MTENNDNGQEFGFDFSHLDIEDKTAVFDLSEFMGRNAHLVCKPATDANKGWYSAMLKASGKRKRQLATGSEYTERDKELDLAEDRELYPRHVIVGWNDIPVKNKAGQEVAFSPEACAAFLKAIPDWLFNRIRVFCMKAENFIDPLEELPDPGSVAKN